MSDYVAFPGLNVELSVPSVAFHIGNKPVYWYGIIIAAALALGYILALRCAKRKNIDSDTITDVVLYSTPAAVICARLYYVIFSFDYYKDHPGEIFEIWKGGIAIYGGIIGAVICAYIYCRIKKLNTFRVFDCCIPSIALGQAIGRWGNFFNKEAFGAETDSFLRMTVFNNGKLINVHPTFLYESVLDLAIFIILYIVNRKNAKDSTAFSLYLILYGISRFFVEGLRSDSLYLGNLRISQAVGLFTAAAGIILLLITYRKSKTIN